ncbi:YqjK-like family protein [Dechloromonas sp. XY25]|uniref:YqjK-like family protein n=1 Tax=Dechloromonas hankyongensis TaxID=2908002 RepID=A0ABS9JYG8_9RHOO|nr:YqjK-like family protein [Dechloromonas hankyongensis]MCG2575947.1 YqjK-like family protein [Dechloromonas hankyongensis]
MNPKLLELATRHGALKVRIDQQRRQLAQHALPLEAALAKGDTVLKGVDWLKHHPAAVGAAVVAIVIAKPKRAWRWARRGVFLWRGWQAAKSTILGERG